MVAGASVLWLREPPTYYGRYASLLPTRVCLPPYPPGYTTSLPPLAACHCYTECSPQPARGAERRPWALTWEY